MFHEINQSGGGLSVGAIVPFDPEQVIATEAEKVTESSWAYYRYIATEDCVVIGHATGLAMDPELQLLDPDEQLIYQYKYVYSRTGSGSSAKSYYYAEFEPDTEVTPNVGIFLPKGYRLKTKSFQTSYSSNKNSVLYIHAYRPA